MMMNLTGAYIQQVKRIVKSSAATALLLVLCAVSPYTYAQLPVCGATGGLVYISARDKIYNWDPSQPLSATNPSLNTIAFPGGDPNWSFGLAVGNNINVPGPSPTFYTTYGAGFGGGVLHNIYYHNGANWVNTGHKMPSTVNNFGGGKSVIYGFDVAGISDAEVWKYNGTGDATLLTVIPGFVGRGSYDIAVDNHDHFYLLRTGHPEQWLRKYDPNGVMVKEWRLTGAPVTAPGSLTGGMAIVCDKIYYNFGDSVRVGVIGDTTVQVTTVTSGKFVFSGGGVAGDFASCNMDMGDLPGGNDTLIELVRGCHTAQISFRRNFATPLPESFRLVISGTAVNGTDYELINTPFQIPANQQEAYLEIKPLPASAATGTRQAVIQVWGKEQSACVPGGMPGSGQQDVLLREIIAIIHDSLDVRISAPDTTCPGEEVTVTATVDPTLDFRWSRPELVSDTSDMTIIDHPTKTTTYSLTAFLPGAPATCPPRKVYYTAVVEQYPEVIAGDVIGCAGDSVAVSVSAKLEGVDYRYQWLTADGLRNDHDADNRFMGAPGTHTKTVRVSTPGAGCTTEDTVVIIIQPSMTFDRIAPADTVIQYGDSVQLFTESEAVKWLWTPGTALSSTDVARPRANPLRDMVYQVTATNEFGCVATAEVRVRVEYNSTAVLPTAFTPNGDGRNDVFRIANLKFEQLTEFKVFNRFGQLVFSTTDPRGGWDGSFNGRPAEVGVYYYIVSVTMPLSNEPKTFRGDVTLIR